MLKNTFNGKGKTVYNTYYRKEFYNDDIIMALDHILQKKYNFPPIEYFIIFKHDDTQSIHHDGLHIPRYASLNLPLSGFTSTKMVFYKIIVATPLNVVDANYYLPENVEPVAELEGSNEWVLVDSSSPHNITNINFTDPRITLCVRFMSNPTLTQLLSKMNGTK